MFDFWKAILVVCFIKEIYCEVEVVDVTITKGSNKRSDKTEDHVTVNFKKKGSNVHIFDLQRQPLLMSDDFVIETQNDKGNKIPYAIEKIKLGCYFEGTIRGVENSLVVMSLCDGIRGFYSFNDSSFEIEKNDNFDSNHMQARVTRTENTSKFKCGVATETEKKAEIENRRQYENKVVSEMRGIEAYVIVDTSLYKKFGNCMARTFDYVRIMFARANNNYNWVNMFLVLKHLEVWTEEDKFDISMDEDQDSRILINFKDYKMSEINSYDHDVAVIMHDHKIENILGLATLSGACNLNKNVLWTTHAFTSNLDYLSEVLTHEIGHALTLPHMPFSACPPKGKCIMRESIIFGKAKFWAESSKLMMKDFLASSRSFCLTKQTKHAWLICGDGVVVEGEECDCGEIPETLCNKKCCDETCHFTRGSQCSTGMCCDIPTCQLKSKGSLCISSDGECQENVVCDGKSSQCINTFSKVFTKCQDDGYCYKGKCRSHNQACRDAMGLFENEVVVANDACYIPGNQPFGDELSRLQKDAKCGVLICYMGLNTPNQRASNLNMFSIEAFNCTYAIIKAHENYGNLNPMYVPEGTKCGDNKVCNEMNCVPIEEFTEGKKPLKENSDRWLINANVIIIALGMALMMYNILIAYRSYRKKRKENLALIKDL